MNPLVRIAIAGCGSSLSLYTDLNQFGHLWTLAGIADPHEANLRKATELWGKLPATADAETLLDLCRPDVLLVCTPPESHARIIVAAARRGVHTLVQKPLARTQDEVDEIRQACIENQVSMRVSFYRRYVTPFRAAATEIQALGPGGMLRVTWTSSSGAKPRSSKHWKEQIETLGGVLVDLGSHIIDTTRWWAGEIVGGKLAMMTTRGALENAASMLLDHRSGVSTLCYVSNIEWEARETYKFTNANGGVTLHQLEQGYPGQWKLATWRKDSDQVDTRVFGVPERNPFVDELADFVASLDQRTVDPEDRGGRVVQVTTELYYSYLRNDPFGALPEHFSLRDAFLKNQKGIS